jgi:sulfite reductase alpha subunit-like flavoprotein
LQPFFHPDARLIPVLSNVELAPDSERHTRHIKFSLKPYDHSRPMMKYTTGLPRGPLFSLALMSITGDHLVLLPPNSPELVDDYLARIAFPPCLQPHEFITVKKRMWH